MEVTGNESCPEIGLRALTLYTVLVGLPTSVLYVFLAVVFVRHVNAFHPLFSVSFFLIITAYTICNVVMSCRNLIEFVMDRNIVYTVLEFIFTLANYYIQPIVVLSLLERLCATIWVQSYENSRPWVVYSLGQSACVAVVIFLYHLNQTQEKMTNNAQFILSIIISTCLVLLLVVNRRLTLASRARSTLTTRYQLAENVRALRIFVPFIVMDNSIWLMFVLTKYLFNVGRTFSLTSCNSYRYYFPLFTFFRTIAMILQILMPIAVIYQQGSVKAWRPECWRRSNKSQDSAQLKKKFKVRNVLGMDVAGHESPEDHFAQLRLQWYRKY
ncbi:unnamed protein product [Caenorhabditis auriculariae]|uniref:Uncharacterized protein n=1 Tax=Caenorhabditis auriculariae TaxID=2777116 RepID=A0A8S1HT48_9PELO|nr:unnamed protein product [Caenorhabditis auriculariae]